MLAVDTNIVVRYLLGGRDDEAQFAKAVALVEGECAAFVSATVLLETEWVLRSVYGIAPRDVVMALQNFVGLPTVQVDDAIATRQALAWMRDGFDFADAMHLVGARRCETFVTFDKAFAKSANAAITAPRVRLA